MSDGLRDLEDPDDTGIGAETVTPRRRVSGRDVAVWRDDLAPRLQSGSRLPFNRRRRHPAAHRSRLLVEADPQRLHLGALSLLDLRCSDGRQQAFD